MTAGRTAWTGRLTALLCALTLSLATALPTPHVPRLIMVLTDHAEMGEIKQQLAAEAEADRQMDAGIEEESSLLDDIFGLFVGSAAAQDAVAEEWRDEISFTLEPGEHAEWKL